VKIDAIDINAEIEFVVTKLFAAIAFGALEEIIPAIGALD
jgi:hypothetical protein